jgi:hypothetical protein
LLLLLPLFRLLGPLLLLLFRLLGPLLLLLFRLLGPLLLLLFRLLSPLLLLLFRLLGPLLLLLLRRLLGPLLLLLPALLPFRFTFFLIVLRVRGVNRPEEHQQCSGADNSNKLHRNCPPLISLPGYARRRPIRP